MRALVVINPVSGSGRRVVEDCAALARRVLTSHGFEARIAVTTARGDARRMVADARSAGVTRVVAWGGDGTINEVGSALAFSDIPMAVVPGGSGNGLARDLGVPLDPLAALELAAAGRTRVIDAGQLDEALFFNVAGLGLDAAIAERLARPGARRGLAGYVQATCAELPRYQARPYRIEGMDGPIEHDAWFVAVANSRQYGNGAQIAPAARLDDGRLDLVVVEAQPLWRVLCLLPSFFRGTLAPGPGLHMSQMEAASISSAAAIAYHVDGEPGLGGRTVQVRIRPSALCVVCP
ncbi:MAG: diacylglycerol kinase family lipid kinase [Acidobacteriota bacterium]|nr:diacylglycerol kinase family lipid kinase [Acidobacteriota bacterium]